MIFSVPAGCVWKHLAAQFVGAVQRRPLPLVPEAGRGSAPQQQLHHRLVSAPHRLVEGRVPLEVSYVHQRVTLHTHTHVCLLETEPSVCVTVM